MMNQVTEEQKSALTKTMAIIGFVAAILFAVWLAVQIVSLIPSAFSSLASLADGVYNYREPAELVVVNENTVVNVGDEMTISWSETNTPGVYSFSYSCTEGAAVSLRQNGDIVNAQCGEMVSLGDTTETTVVVESEKQRFIDVPYTITFTPEEGEPVRTDSKITVVNASIPALAAVLEGEEDEIEETTEEVVTETESEVEETPEPEVAGETTTEEEAPAPVAVPEPEVIEEIIYAIPTSDPNGDVDLVITYLGVGILTSNNTFVRAATIGTDQTGAFQFEVKNIGTKTSDEWSYEATLPSDIEYESGTQEPLKPNERAVITIGFDGIARTGTESFGAELAVEDDTNSRNDAFTWAVTVVE